LVPAVLAMAGLAALAACGTAQNLGAPAPTPTAAVATTVAPTTPSDDPASTVISTSPSGTVPLPTTTLVPTDPASTDPATTASPVTSAAAAAPTTSSTSAATIPPPATTAVKVLPAGQGEVVTPTPRTGGTATTAPPAGSSGKVTPGTPAGALGRIVIPKLGIDVPMYEGVDLPTLNKGPGHWPGTAAPGQLGNAVFAGHRVSHTAPFRYIDKLVPGDQVIFTVSGISYTYMVTGSEIVLPSAVWIVNQTPDATATLFACHPPGSTAFRWVVHLKLLS
jgi:sortase A